MTNSICSSLDIVERDTVRLERLVLSLRERFNDADASDLFMRLEYSSSSSASRYPNKSLFVALAKHISHLGLVSEDFRLEFGLPLVKNGAASCFFVVVPGPNDDMGEVMEFYFEAGRAGLWINASRLGHWRTDSGLSVKSFDDAVAAIRLQRRQLLAAAAASSVTGATP